MWFLALPILSIAAAFGAEGWAAKESENTVKYLTIGVTVASVTFLVWKFAKK